MTSTSTWLMDKKRKRKKQPCEWVVGSAVGESFSRSHGCTSYSLHPPLQCWVPYRSLAAPMWPSVDSLPLASRSSSCNDVTPCLALSLSCTTSPFACRKCAFKSFGFRNPRVLLIGYSWVWVEIIRHSRYRSVSRSIVNHGSTWHTERIIIPWHTSAPRFVAHSTSAFPTGQILLDTGNFWKYYLYIFLYTYKVLYRTLNWIGEPAAL